MGDPVLFEELTERAARQLGKDFIPNKVISDSDKLLDPTRLVVKIDSWKWKPDYRVSDYKLEDILEDVPPPETKKVVLLNDFYIKSEQSGTGGLFAKGMSRIYAALKGRSFKQIHCQLGQLDKMELEDVNKLKTDIQGVASTKSDKKKEKKTSSVLRLRKKKTLVLVKEWIMAKDSFSINCYDEVDAKVTGGVNITAEVQMGGGVDFSKNNKVGMKLPANTVIAYRVLEIMELTKEGNRLEADSETGSVNFLYDESINCLDTVLNELEKYTMFYQPLDSLPKQTKSSLLAELREVLGDRTTFQKFLEEKLLQTVIFPLRDEVPTLAYTCLHYWSAYPHIQCEAWCTSVSTHLDKLPTKPPEDYRVVVESLVKFLEALPDVGLNMLANCCFSELQALNKLVAELKTKRSNILPPETLPPKLQDGGEYDWATQLLCSANENLQDRTLFMETGFQPGGLLLILCIAVQGLTFLWS